MVKKYGQRRALTIWQPLASFLFLPAGSGYWKTFETRGWATDYRGELAIHAASKDLAEVLRTVHRISTLQAIGEGLIRMWYPDGAPEGVSWEAVVDELSRTRDPRLPRKAVIGTVELVDCIEITEDFRAKQSKRELALGNWRIGNYAWKLRKRRLFPAPVTCNGQQGLWLW